MIEHIEARELISARADGELDQARAAELDAHLAGCEACSTFETGVGRLRARAQQLSVEHAPAGLAFRVQRARHRVPRAIAAVAAVVAIAMVVVTTQPTSGFRLPGAQAARALTEIETLYVDRVIEYEREFEPVIKTVTRERIWFRAPDLLRIERTTSGEGYRSTEVIIERGSERYEKRSGTAARHLVNIAPDARTPIEPLSTTLAVLGKRLGAGPHVAGRATIRFEATIEGEKRVALVDAERFTLLGTEPLVVLEKVRTTETRRTLSIRYNEAIPDARFRIPAGLRPIDRGFRAASADDLHVVPRAVPDGFELLGAGTTRRAEFVTYAHGAFLLIVSSSETAFVDQDPGAPVVFVGTRRGFVNIPLYGVPVLVFEHQGREVRIEAPLAPDELAELAVKMFPE